MNHLPIWAPFPPSLSRHRFTPSPASATILFNRATRTRLRITIMNRSNRRITESLPPPLLPLISKLRNGIQKALFLFQIQIEPSSLWGEPFTRTNNREKIDVYAGIYLLAVFAFDGNGARVSPVECLHDLGDCLRLEVVGRHDTGEVFETWFVR